MHALFMEALGTYYILVILSLTVNPIAIGLMIMAMTCVGVLISGAHFNSAVSLAFVLHQKLSIHKALAYLGAQVTGALLALWSFYMVTGLPYIPETIIDMPLICAMGIEAKLTAVLCLVALTVASSKIPGNTPAVRGFAIGLTFISMAFVGGLFNPSIALAIMISNFIQNTDFATLQNALIYVIAPFIGSALASLIHSYFCKNLTKEW